MDDETQHSRAANPFIRYSPAPLTQQPTINGAPKGPFEDAQQPEPCIAANPTRPPTYKNFFFNTGHPFRIFSCMHKQITELQHKKQELCITFRAIPPLEAPDAMWQSQAIPAVPHRNS